MNSIVIGNPKLALLGNCISLKRVVGWVEVHRNPTISPAMFVCVGFHSSSQSTHLFELISNLNITGDIRSLDFSRDRYFLLLRFCRIALSLIVHCDRG
jgi:hypothetical protein